MATVTLLDLRTRARQRADMESTGFISDSELNTYINSSYAELYDLLVSKFGSDYFVSSPYTFTTSANVDQYPLPSGFYKLLGVDFKISGTNWRTLKRFEFSDRNISGIWDVYNTELIRYRLLGSNILLSPVPTGACQLRAWYIPLPDVLANDTDSFSGLNGYEEYVIIDAAIKMLTKEESDTSALRADKAAMKKRIEDMADSRDVGSPCSVQDTNGIEGWSLYFNSYL
jgi:hypothetical protein